MDPPAERARLGKRPVRMVIWILGTLGFAWALFASAKLGIRHAEERVPSSELSIAGDYEIASEVTFVVTGGKPLAFADTQPTLRNYHFREGARAGSGIADAGEDEVVFEHGGGPVRVRVLEIDSDLVRVQIITGPRAGGKFWIKKPPIAKDD